MKLIVIAGWKSQDWRVEPDRIYWGLDGVEAEKAAKEAQQSGKYAKGAIKQKFITDWTPKACVPVPEPSTVAPAVQETPTATIETTKKKAK